MSSESIKVIVRCRPFSQKEKEGGHSNIINIDSNIGSCAIVDPRTNSSTNEPPRQFTFDYSFDWNSTQREVYDKTASSIVESVLAGFNGTIFAYGQTGTGKTHSMEGDRSVPDLRGIIPNAFEHIFQHIRTSGGGAQYLVRASYLEIYNEEIWDLLNTKNGKLDIKERPDTGVYVKDLSTFVIKDVEEAYKLMALGNSNRSVAATNMNARSSRSHSIFTITVECSELGPDGENHIRVGKLNLVDLAGSERQSKTGATGDRLKEAAKINLSLTALGNVISALVDGKSTHIPYRDSKLTRLLQDSLGGNSKTMMIATLSPASYNFEETLSTLRYANRAKNIKNKPKINEDPKDAMLREFQDEINKLKAQLESIEGGHGIPDENVVVVEEIEEVEETDDEDEGGEEDGERKRFKKDKKRRGSKSKSGKGAKQESESVQALHHTTDAQLAALQSALELEREMILSSKDMLENEKQRILEELQKRADEIAAERAARDEVAAKLAKLQEKLLVGGVNLLDKHEEQQLLLQKQAAELEERRQMELNLKRELERQEEEALKIEESYSSLQEEAASKTKKLKRVWQMLMDQKAELKDTREEWIREKEDLLDTIRDLSRELKLKLMVIGSFIPDQELNLIEELAEYDDATEKWRIAGMHLAGNNIKNKKKHGQSGLHQRHFAGADDEWENWDPLCVFGDVYLSYDVPLRKGSRRKISTAGGASARSVVDAAMRNSGSPYIGILNGAKSGSVNSSNTSSRSTLGADSSNPEEGSKKMRRSREEVKTPSVRGLVGSKRHYA